MFRWLQELFGLNNRQQSQQSQQIDRLQQQINAVINNETEYITLHRVERKKSIMRSVIPYKYKTNEYLAAVLNALLSITASYDYDEAIYVQLFCIAVTDGLEVIEKIASFIAREYPGNAQTAIDYINDFIEARDNGEKVHVPECHDSGWRHDIAYYSHKPLIVFLHERSLLKDLVDDLESIGLL